MMCGTPYQIYQYDEENNRIPDTTPIIKIHEQYFDELRAYWNETHARNGLGMYVEWKSERLAFENWVNARKTPIT